MFKKIIFLLCIITTLSAKAHQPDVSTTMLVEKENNTWVLQISASLSAFQQEIKTHFSETPYKTPEEFQQMVLEHFKKNIFIQFNENQMATLSDGYVRLGHETKVVFEVFNVPSEQTSVEIKNSAFKDIHRNQSALVLLKDGFNKEHFILNNANEHTVTLAITTDRFIETAETKPTYFSSKMLVVSLAILLLVSCFAMVKKKYKERKVFQK
ncbi:DUF6702 family protein [Ulvibacter litoralis]|uniref:LPXTG-motif cell wall anchor domain-containing protein n=1 Tax=Ulvibacter litoralis TaxID=227084 RepID=A0A1G7FH21_9FLAO|nr:DUF6702 family protein [Ulvibacter litoralis]GHC51165.1 hypothetical protein GCM10008083_13480 [Ulvibacter litoralis]SDE75204.1 hypothetical protein SAMN05421855_102559 [Ulvibacter litoralis]